MSELRRRNVFRMAALYAVAAWLIMQVGEVLVTLAALPDWAGQAILVLLVIGFPIALIFSWFYELTPEGISLERDVDRAKSITHITGRRLDFIVISLLCAAVILLAYDKWWMPGPPENSVAVLPFTNMSGDPDQEYFSDGISEELLNVLAQLPGTHVPARTSSFQFKGRHEDIAEIADALNVTHILEGSVRKSGNQLRITAQLVKADDGFHIWSARYDRELDDVFAVQDEIVGAISDALKVKLALVEGEATQPTVTKAANTEAYDAYLRGREMIRRRGWQNVEEAVRHLERSLRLDDSFAPAHAHLGIAAGLLLYYGKYNLEETKRIAIPHLDRAQELEPNLAEAHGGRANLALAGDPEGAIEHARKALAANPNYADAMNWLYNALWALGRYEEADAALEQMLVTDPLTIVGRANYNEWLSETAQLEEAHEMADQLLAQSPRWGYFAHANTSLLFEGKIAEGLSWGLKHGREIDHFSIFVFEAFRLVGEYDEARRTNDDIQTIFVDVTEGRFDAAIRTAQRNLRLNPDNEFPILVAAHALYVAGHLDEALPLFERLLDFVPQGRPVSSENFPLVSTMRLALARRNAGDEEGAQAAAQIVRQDHAARRATGRRNQEQYHAQAMIAAFEHHPDRAIAALKSAIQHGLRDPLVFDDHIFEDLWDEPRFIALQQELDAILAEEHDKVLQLICFNNPGPDDWQPLPETCEGVVEQGQL